VTRSYIVNIKVRPNRNQKLYNWRLTESQKNFKQPFTSVPHEFGVHYIYRNEEWYRYRTCCTPRRTGYSDCFIWQVRSWFEETNHMLIQLLLRLITEPARWPAPRLVLTRWPCSILAGVRCIAQPSGTRPSVLNYCYPGVRGILFALEVFRKCLFCVILKNFAKTGTLF